MLNSYVFLLSFLRIMCI